jgi:hypothetical protein
MHCGCTYLNNISEDSGFIRAGDTRRLLGRNTNKRQALLLENVIRLNFCRHLLVCRLQICTHDGKREIIQEVSQLLLAAVKLVVAKSHSVKAQLVDGLRDLLSPVERIE